ncbi:hypothetical protein [Archangium violaceum]|uniref:Lipoprotein n=1 Tax=Archangium violaceum Cb vi76 TaxID=1406225 RepID=A0A084SWX0_9BACT|nr:hypothetical protein [Archangium violaceum]KFA92955.1 hypothetical protein Q664_11725 [Archangium violaceum Cb vi76]
MLPPSAKRCGPRALALLPLLAACGGGLESEPTSPPETGTQQSPVVQRQKLSKGLTTRTGDSPDACWL